MVEFQPHPLLLCTQSLHSIHISLVIVLQTYQGHLRPFALAVSSTWNAFPQNVHMPHSSLYSNVTFSAGLLWPLYPKFIPPPPATHTHIHKYTLGIFLPYFVFY